TGFLMALAKVDRSAPRILSRQAHQREQQAQQDEQARIQQQVQDLAASFTQQLAQRERSMQQQLAQSMHLQLAHERAAMQETVQQLAKSVHMQLATELAAVQASVQMTRSELATLQAEGQEQSQEHGEPEKRVVLRAVPRREQQGEQDKVDARACVFACLQEDPTAKLAELANRALTMCHVELSHSTMSRYRKQYFARGASADEELSLPDASADASRVAST
ncbi:MAG: hypothetical protein JO202_12365, partial [Ktedonobacteraceae bacterium]|nr:hypothetical protein [Ktedonobacteraceae bacterium]